ncbi:MAG: sensor histidine kinase, partial [Frankiaceae bacterium]|nr:sensor histidine kinase [Frankiaceae bacterium]MBV9369586.1 sensor histidine kinase [Frankiales bacterium]
GDLEGSRLEDVTTALAARRSVQAVESSIAAVARGRSPLWGELEARDAVLALRSLPLRPGGEHIGALVLVHDVTELRTRERQLMGKDATIREIHHRVKNNLQTVAALLRLQARRMAVPEARAALEESVRRVSSIAVVHETLSGTLDEAVNFDGVADRIASMVMEVTTAPGAVAIRRTGTFGVLPAEVATPLAMVLTELLQNAAEHGFTGLDRAGQVAIEVDRDDAALAMAVRDDGRGLPPGFRLDGSDRLGLQIVRTLVESELGGTIEIGTADGGGTVASVRVGL